MLMAKKKRKDRHSRAGHAKEVPEMPIILITDITIGETKMETMVVVVVAVEMEEKPLLVYLELREEWDWSDVDVHARFMIWEQLAGE